MITSAQTQLVEEKARKLRHDIVDMIGHGGTAGHLGGSCSSADLVASLYFYKMAYDAKTPQAPDRDRFLMSKGHAVLVQYAALAEAGFFPREWLWTVKKLGSRLQGHPDMTKTPGIEANTGSLGQGLSLGVGMALGMRLDKNTRKVYVVVGDGELQEGQIWEAAMFAAGKQLDNLVAVLDCNGLQATGATRDRMDLGDIAAKWRAFGWHVLEVDGHDVGKVCAALDALDEVKGKPSLLLAKTVKGKGVSFAEGQAAFHNTGLTQEQFDTAHADLDKAI